MEKSSITATSLRILFVNHALSEPGGTELFVRDLAIALQKRGHLPLVYSTELGRVAEEIREHAIPVISDLGDISWPPDVIHGHHHLDLASVALYFPRTPIVYVCHGWVPWQEMPISLPNIKIYVAVSRLTREWLFSTARVPRSSVRLIPNFVDTDRFLACRTLPERPKTALLFGHWDEHPHAQAIMNACRRAGITQIEIVGGKS